MLPVLGRRRGDELLFYPRSSNGGRCHYYTDLTGKPELPPLWALYHQCKWSYFPESNVKEITSKFRIKNTM
jgi:hypothetical protein